ncbi:MAG: heavy metal translocating P-type ATPase, partial [Clostridia bacterium]|nr:heavy metal translocating P-type ATPase [Clostridia bacterium]
DRFLGYYIPFVLGVAALVALVTRDISKAIAILVVSCPCGQMLVSSAPMIAALSVATKRGVLIKNSKFIEELTEIDTVVFDKTGTITKGELSLTELCPVEGVDTDALLAAATSVAVASTHPVSRAVVDYATARGIAFEKEIAVKEISGGGVEGTLQDGGVIRFGRREWLESVGCTIPADFAADALGSISFVARDTELLGCLCFNDTVREDAKSSVAALRDLGAERTVMLTGDRTAPAKRICESVGIDELHAELLPQDKLDRLRELGGDEHGVLVVGDGINDALALREADVGIAMGAMGSDLAIESADIALMNNNLDNIPFVVSLAKKTRGTIYQNLALSILISVTMIGLSAFGIISSLAGSIFHNVGAFAVLLNSSRILRFNKK